MTVGDCDGARALHTLEAIKTSDAGIHITATSAQMVSLPVNPRMAKSLVRRCRCTRAHLGFRVDNRNFAFIYIFVGQRLYLACKSESIACVSPMPDYYSRLLLWQVGVSMFLRPSNRDFNYN